MSWKRIIFFCGVLFAPVLLHAQTKALVGGTLIDGFGAKPIYNSVIIIEGEKIKAVGTVGELAAALSERTRQNLDNFHDDPIQFRNIQYVPIKLHQIIMR